VNEEQVRIWHRFKLDMIRCAQDPKIACAQILGAALGFELELHAMKPRKILQNVKAILAFHGVTFDEELPDARPVSGRLLTYPK
jgi:hypothetical protein